RPNGILFPPYSPAAKRLPGVVAARAAVALVLRNSRLEMDWVFIVVGITRFVSVQEENFPRFCARIGTMNRCASQRRGPDRGSATRSLLGSWRAPRSLSAHWDHETSHDELLSHMQQKIASVATQDLHCHSMFGVGCSMLNVPPGSWAASTTSQSRI